MCKVDDVNKNRKDVHCIGLDFKCSLFCSIVAVNELPIFGEVYFSSHAVILKARSSNRKSDGLLSNVMTSIFNSSTAIKFVFLIWTA